MPGMMFIVTCDVIYCNRAKTDRSANPRDRAGPARERACARLRQCGAHYVVDAITDILPCIDAIEARMRRGETP